MLGISILSLFLWFFYLMLELLCQYMFILSQLTYQNRDRKTIWKSNQPEPCILFEMFTFCHDFSLIYDWSIFELISNQIAIYINKNLYLLYVCWNMFTFYRDWNLIYNWSSVASKSNQIVYCYLMGVQAID